MTTSQIPTVQSSLAFASERAQGAGHAYGAHTIELLAVKPIKEVSK